MTFACFKGSGKFPSKNDKLIVKQSGTESSLLRFLRITGGMLFRPAASFTLRDFITFSISSGLAGCLNKDFSFGFLGNIDMLSLFGKFASLIYQLLDVKNLLKWLVMALSSVVITSFIHKLSWHDFLCVFDINNCINSFP